MNKKTRINHTLIKSRSVYITGELAKVLGVCRVTIRNWIKKGMKVLDKEANPYLILGSDAREFIIKRKNRHKKPTKNNEFYCPRCKVPRLSDPEATVAKYTGKQFISSKQIIIYGICLICRCPLRYFSSDKHIKKLIEAGMSIKEGANILMSNTSPSSILSGKEIKNEQN